MKKIYLMLLLIAVLLTTSLPAAAAENTYDEEIKAALELMKETWQGLAEENPEIMPAPYVDIKHTRILNLSEYPVDVQNNQPVEGLEGIDYIIEFLMMTNYMGDSYPCNFGVYDTVVVYENGEMSVPSTNLMRIIRSKYFLMDFSGVIEEIIDLENAYNGLLF